MSTSYINRIASDEESIRSQLFLFLKNGTFVISLAAIAQVYFISVFLSIPLNLAVVVAPLLGFGIYGINNITDTEEDAVNLPWSGEFTRLWHRFIGPLAVVVHFVGVGIAFYVGGLVPGLLSLVPLGAQIGYSQAWLPFEGAQRLKQILLLNSTVVAGAWIVNVVALPIAFSTGASPGIAAVTLGLFIYVRWMMSVEVANVPDTQGDRSASVDSLPLEFGYSKTRQVMYFLEGVSLVLLLIAATQVSNTLAVLAVTPVLLYSGLCSYLFCRPERESYLSFWWDVSFVLMGLGALLVDYVVGLQGGLTF